MAAKSNFIASPKDIAAENFVIKERPAKEVHQRRLQLDKPKGMIRNLGFDLTDRSNRKTYFKAKILRLLK